MLCRTAKPTDKTQKLADGYGLYLEVTPKGSKLWRFRYRYERKFKLISLGIYPFVTLSEARAALADYKRLLDRGIDPSIPDRLFERLEELANYEGRSVSNLVSYLLEPSIDEQYRLHGRPGQKEEGNA